MPAFFNDEEWTIMKDFKKRFIAMSTMAAMITSAFVPKMQITAADAMRSIYYTAGDVDNMVSASSFIFAVPEGCSFEYCDSSRFSRKGYKITSWYVHETGQTVGINQPAYMPDYDLHVSAVWEPVKYSICFAGVGGVTDAGENNIYVDGTYGTTIKLPSNPFKKDGYRFAGWEYDGVIYDEQADFTVPGVISGGRIVLAAVWTRESASVTTAPETPASTTTTSTTVTSQQPVIIAANQKVKSFRPNVSFNSADETFRVYVSDIIDRYDSVDSIDFIFETNEEKCGDINMGFATILTNGVTYQQNFGDYVNSNTFTITIDKNICEQISYSRYFQFVCWNSSVYPLNLVEARAIVRENTASDTDIEDEPGYDTPADTSAGNTPEPVSTTAPAETETTTTTTTTVVTEGAIRITFKDENGETTTTTEMIDIPVANGGMAAPVTETTTTAAETTAETTTEITSETTVAAEETPFETVPTEPVQMNDNVLSRVVNIGENIDRDSSAILDPDEFMRSNEKIVRMDIAVSSGERIGQYSMGVIMNMEYGTMLGRSFSEYTEGMNAVLTVTNDSDLSLADNTYLTIGYWWGDASAVTIDSITLYYTICDEDKDPVVETEPAPEPEQESAAEPEPVPQTGSETEPEEVPTEEPEPVEIKQDYDGDGVITKNDVAILSDFLLGASAENVFHEDNDYDINGDGKINVYDFIALQRMYRDMDKEEKE